MFANIKKEGKRSRFRGVVREESKQSKIRQERLIWENSVGMENTELPTVQQVRALGYPVFFLRVVRFKEECSTLLDSCSSFENLYGHKK